MWRTNLIHEFKHLYDEYLIGESLELIYEGLEEGLIGGGKIC